MCMLPSAEYTSHKSKTKFAAAIQALFLVVSRRESGFCLVGLSRAKLDEVNVSKLRGGRKTKMKQRGEKEEEEE